MEGAVTFFAIRLIAGIAGWCCLLAAPRHRVVSPLFRIQMLLVLGLAVVAGLAGPTGSGPWAIALGLVSFAGSVFWLLERRQAGRFATLIVFAIALVWLAKAIHGWDSSANRWLAAGGAIASAATLGTTMCGMLLGHRYLTAPGMPLEPLGLANAGVGWAALVRLVVSGVALVLIGSSTPKGLFGDQVLILWLVLRWLAGIFGLFVVCYMTQRILVYRNTQAATGVLFVGVILAFIGELTGDLLFRTLGSPL